jgi:hypothetical protein
MVQAVSRQPLIAEARVRARVSPYGIYDGQSGTGPSFPSSFPDFPSILFYHDSPHSNYLGD